MAKQKYKGYAAVSYRIPPELAERIRICAEWRELSINEYVNTVLFHGTEPDIQAMTMQRQLTPHGEGSAAP